MHRMCWWKMARASKSAVVLCLDVGHTMGHAPPGHESPFEQAKRVLLMFVQRQVFAESKDETALVLYGSDATSNPLAGADQYQHITVHRNLMIPDFSLLEDVQSRIEPGLQQADFLDALVVCMDVLQKQTLGKKYEKLHIAVFTDLNSPFSSDQLDIIIANLRQAGITLQFFLPFPLDSDGEGGGCGDADSGVQSDRSRGHPPGKGLTTQQKEGVKMVRKVMTAFDEEFGLDEVFTFSESAERLGLFKKLERRPMPWPCQLTIGSNISIRIVGYKAMCEEKVKKAWISVDAKTLQKEDVRKEVVYCLNDDDETEILKDETIQGFRYGSDIIPFSRIDQDQMKYKTDGKCFSVLGFTKSSQVLRHYNIGRQTLKVLPPKDDEHAAVALSALIQALEEMDMVAIVRYVYDRRSNPQVGVAFPLIKEEYQCLVYIQLPFMEDLRQFTFASLSHKRWAASEEQLAAVDSLIDSMGLVQEDGEKTQDLFKVSKIPNPHYQRLFQCLQYKAFHPDQPLPPIEAQLTAMLERPQEVSVSCQPALQHLKSLFTLQDAGKKKEPKIAQKIFNNVEEPDAKRARLDDEEFCITRLAEGRVTSVGSLHPAKDFRFLISQKSDFREVSSQLKERVWQFLAVKGREYYIKSMDCISAFREEAVKAGKAQLFNTFIKTLKESVEEKGLYDFWDLLVQDGVSLITQDEAGDSAVTEDEAKRFLAAEERAAEPEAVAEDGGDVDDLLDMM
uniref:X-ray repair cross-complementing protein 5 n=1 Tax=Callorhinchus milii TaxID=7868 RepID=A0A4W3JFY9_CALMI|eukprot:gi/632982730/ref/XP_007908297.1/ PREDICTED: X-ray repair cross-complementing protein 5 isoform X1 [Callorhinchus milii]